MGITYKNLDVATRGHMLEELALGGLYESPRLTPLGLASWPVLLEEAIRNHDDDWLAQQILMTRALRREETYVRNGRTHSRAINSESAAQMLAEGEFNRFYMRGLCLKAMKEGQATLTVYRGKSVSQPRPESEALIGKTLQVETLLDALRSNDFVTIEKIQGVPGGPNSGLTCKL